MLCGSTTNNDDDDFDISWIFCKICDRFHIYGKKSVTYRLKLVQDSLLVNQGLLIQISLSYIYFFFSKYLHKLVFYNIKLIKKKKIAKNSWEEFFSK